MTRIKARTPAGGEYSFYTLEEFVSAIERGRVKPDWEVFHSMAGRWLPVTAHPAFAQAYSRASENVAARRSSELVLIYPEQKQPEAPGESPIRPTAATPALAPAEIERVLSRRYSQPHSAAGEKAWSTAVRRPSGPRAPLVTIPQPERSGVAVVFERVLIAGIILVLIGMAINSSQNQHRRAATGVPAGQPERPRTPVR
jgi:hypothetical protein